MHISVNMLEFFLFLSNFVTEIYSLCSCDRLSGICDQNCCCDRNCTKEDLLVFQNCFVSNLIQKDESCIYSDMVFGVNGAFRNYLSTDKNICFVKTFYSDNTFYEKPNLVSTINETESLSMTYDTTRTLFPYSNQEIRTRIPKALYEAGDSIIVYFDEGLIGIFKIPTNDQKNICNQMKHIEFLSNSSSVCTRELVLTDNETSCTALPTIDQFTTGFRFVQPSVNFTQISLRTNQSANSSNLSDNLINTIQIRSILCKTRNGTYRTCPTGSATFDFATKTCSNVLTEINFVILTSNSSIIQVNIDAVVQDGLNHSFDQTFRVFFINNITSSISLPPQPLPEAYLSGSPGYIKRFPVRAGVTKGSYIQMLPPVPITLPDDRQEAGGQAHGWWPVIAGGTCKSPAITNGQILTIRFGVNMQTACLLRYRANVSQNGQIGTCTALQNKIISVLNKPYAGSNLVPTHVARWGNSSSTNTSDWLPITTINPRTNRELTAGKRSCQNIIVGKTILFVYAKRGRVHMAQREIIAVFSAYQYGTIEFKCGGRYCTPNNADLEQTTPIHTIVRFHDASVAPNSRTRTASVDETDLTGDLYYPFNVESAASWSEY